MADSASKIREQHEPKTPATSTKAEDQHLAEIDDGMEIESKRSEFAVPLEQLAAKQQQTTVQNALWRAVVVAVSDAEELDPRFDRRRLDRLREELARAHDDKKKQNAEISARDPVIFEKVESIFGKHLAERIALKIDKIVAEQSATLQRDPAAVGRISADLVAILSGGSAPFKISVSPPAIDNALTKELGRSTVAGSLLANLPANLVDKVAVGSNLLESARTNPVGVSAYLQTKEGVESLRTKLSTEGTVEAREKLLVSLKETLGSERFAAVVDAIDKHTGAPLVAHCVQLAGVSQSAQQAVVKSLLEPSKQLLTEVQLKRFSEYTVSSSAAVLESLRMEYQRIPEEITATERARFKTYEHAAKELGVDTPGGVTTESSRKELLDAIAERFTGLKDCSWEKASQKLRDVAAVNDEFDSAVDDKLKSRTENLEDFSKLAAELGIEILPQEPTLGEAEKQTPEPHHIHEHREARIAEMAQVKELAVRLFTHMREIEGLEKRLEELKLMRADGPDREREKVLARFEALYKGIVSGFSRESIESQQAASRVYIEDLRVRIEQATDPLKLQALCNERDSIEWQALNIRIRALLGEKPPKNERIAALVREFQLAHPDLLRGRQRQFIKAADDVAGCVSSVNNYIKEVETYYETELRETENKVESLKKRVKDLDGQIEEQEKEVDSYNYGTDEYYITIPTSEQKKASETLRQQKRHRTDKTQALLRQEVKLETLRDAIKSLPGLRTLLLEKIGDVSSPNLYFIDPKQMEALCEPGQDKLEQISGLKSRFKELDEYRQRSTSALTRSDLIGQATCTKAGFVTHTSSEVSRLNGILTADPTTQISDDGLKALARVVPADSSLGKSLAAVLQSSRPSQEKMDLVLARLSVEDTLRLKLFLLSYNRLDVYELTGRDKPSDPRELWDILSRCHNAEEERELEDLAITLPQLLAIRECQELFDKLSPADRSLVLEEYQKISLCSLGESLLSRVPAASPARIQILLALCEASFVQSQDLASLFSGGIVPEDIRERRSELARLIREDVEAEPKVPTEFDELIQEQARERALLQAALPAMIQMDRTLDVESIRKRLSELDSKFYRSLTLVLSEMSPGFVARSGLREKLENARNAVTAITQIELVDPYGEISLRAMQLVDALSNADSTRAASDALDSLLQDLPEQAQMMLLEVMYRQHASQKQVPGITGDLRADIRAKSEGLALSSDKLDRILRGERDACDSYDLERLTLGLRTKDPQLTVRAMLALEAREGGRQALQFAIENKEEIRKFWQENVAEPLEPVEAIAKGTFNEAKELFLAIKNHEETRIQVIKVVNGASWAAQKGANAAEQIYNAVGELAPYAAYPALEVVNALKHVYGETYEFRRATGEAIKVTWDKVWNSNPADRAKELVSYSLRSIDLEKALDIAVVGKAVAMIPVEHRKAAAEEIREFFSKLPASAVYKDGRRDPSIIDFVRQAGGKVGDADVRLFEAILSGNINSDERSTNELKYYFAERQRILYQLNDLSDLRATRLEIHNQAVGVLQTVTSMYMHALRDQQGRMFEGRARAKVVVDIHDRMRLNQVDLLRGLNIGIEDLGATQEIIRVRGVALLQDILRREDRGLTSDQGDRDLREVRQRDSLREWIVAREDAVERWQHNAKVAQGALDNYDFWFDVSLSVGKLAVCIAVTALCPNPLTAAGAVFAVATIWNAVDKTYRVIYRGLDTREAVRQFAIEAAIDAACVVVCFGVSRFRIKLTAKSTKGVVKSETIWKLLTRGQVKQVAQGYARPEELLEEFGERLGRAAGKLVEAVEKDALLRPGSVALSFEKAVKVKEYVAAMAGGTLLKTVIAEGSKPPRQKPSVSGPQRDLTVSSQPPKTPPLPAPTPIGAGAERERQVEDNKGNVNQAVQPQTPQQASTPIEAAPVNTTPPAPELPAIEATVQKVEAPPPPPPPQEPAPVQVSAEKEVVQPVVASGPNIIDKLLEGLLAFLDGLGKGTDAPPPPVIPPSPPPTNGGDSGGKGSDSGPPGGGEGLGLRVHLEDGRRRSQGTEGSQSTRASGDENRSLAEGLDLSTASMSQVAATKVATADGLHLANAFASARGENNSLILGNQNDQSNHLQNFVRVDQQVAQRNSAAIAAAQDEQMRVPLVTANRDSIGNSESPSVPTIVAESSKRDIRPEKERQELEYYMTHLKELESEKRPGARVQAEAVLSGISKEVAEGSNLSDSQQILSASANVPRLVAQKQDEVSIVSEVAKQAVVERSDEVRRDVIARDGQVPQESNIGRKNSAASATLLDKPQEISTATSEPRIHEEVVSLRTSQAAPLVTPQSEKKDASSIELRAQELGDIRTSVTPRIEAPKATQAEIPRESSAWSEVDADSQYLSGVTTRGRRKARRNAKDEERLRKIIMDQLMRQAFEKSKREKLLRMLASLGMTEQEYRAFLAQLRSAEVSRKEAAKIEKAQKVAVAVESFAKPVAPKLKEEGPAMKGSRTAVVKTRADHYARLRSQSTDKILH